MSMRSSGSIIFKRSFSLILAFFSLALFFFLLASAWRVVPRVASSASSFSSSSSSSSSLSLSSSATSGFGFLYKLEDFNYVFVSSILIETLRKGPHLLEDLFKSCFPLEDGPELLPAQNPEIRTAQFDFTRRFWHVVDPGKGEKKIYFQGRMRKNKEKTR